MIYFNCVYCGQKISAQENSSGKRGKCPKCSHMLRVPWTMKGRPGIGGEKIEQQPSPTSDENSSSNKTPDYIPGFLNARQPAFNTGTLLGDKAGWLIPSYDELSLFLIAFTLLMLIISNILVTHDAETILRIRIISGFASDLRILFLLILFFLGFLLSLYHVFTKREKTRTEKYLMVFFAVTSNAAIGIITGIYILRQNHTWQMVFPIWNIVNGVLLILMLRAGIINESCVSDQKSKPGRVVIGSTITIVIFIVCNYIFRLYWAVTFSICIIYATNFEKSLQGLLKGKAILTKA